MDSYEISLTVVGVAFLAAAILPRLLEKYPLSLPIVNVALGMGLAAIWPAVPHIDPLAEGKPIEKLTELAVIISLTVAGLKLDRPLTWNGWRSTRRLLLVTMPLCIIVLAAGCYWLLGWPLAVAVMLGAVMAPTDPVLAADVQVGPPQEGKETEPRFALTSEAGLNDGLAFPFVNLAIVLAATGLSSSGLQEWVLTDVVWKIAIALLSGVSLGYGLAWLIFRWREFDPVSDGFLSVALTLSVYGATELLHGYGFLGVFVAALVFRRYEHSHDYHKTLHDFCEQIERMMMSLLLIGFGISIAGGLLSPLTWTTCGFGLIFLLVIRPLTGLLALWGTPIPFLHRVVIAVFGIRGLGTFYYLAYGMNHTSFSESHLRELWGLAGWIVLASIILHGISVSLVMKKLNRPHTGIKMHS